MSESNLRGRRFVIDRARCTGCATCLIACKDNADLDDGTDWIRIETLEGGIYPHVRVSFRVVHCFHCEQPACVQACPTAALAQNPAGWVTLDQALCIACGACLDSCPFGAIATDSEGHATKCDGCAAQVSAGAEPTCVRACPMRALRLDSADACPNRISDATWDDAGMAPRVRYLVRSAPELEVPDA